MGVSRTWHEDDSFWAAMHPVFFTERHWADARKQAASVARLIGLQPGASVLDLACGPGRHAIELARSGFDVTAVDRTAFYLDEARSRASALGLQIEFVMADMRAIEFRDRFDAVVNLSTSFGYFEDPSDDLAALQNVFAALKPGGTFLIETMGIETVARSFVANVEYALDDGTRVEEKRVPLDGGDTFEKTRTVTRPGADPVIFSISHRLYSTESMCSLLDACGFEAVRIFGSIDGGPYDDSAEMLVAAAHRP